MDNVIQIKRGTRKPKIGELAPYELGLDITDTTAFQLYVGGPLGANQQYGDAKGIKVDIAEKAEGAISIVDKNGVAITIGSQTSPIYLEDGKFKNCSGATISGTIEKANMLSNARTIGVQLNLDEFADFNGQNDITTGVQGTLPISKGGTGATNEQEALVKLGALSSAGGTLTGPLTLFENQYGDNYGIDCKNSNIIGVNGLYFNANDQVDSSGEGICFYRQVGIWDVLYAKNGILRFSPNQQKDGFSEGQEIVHTGNHFTSLVDKKTLSNSNTSFTISGVGGYTGFVFYATTAGSSDDGICTVMVPAGLISTSDKSFVLGHAADSKIFKVRINNGTMTVSDGGFIGDGIASGSFGVYGIK